MSTQITFKELALQISVCETIRELDALRKPITAGKWTAEQFLRLQTAFINKKMQIQKAGRHGI